MTDSVMTSMAYRGGDLELRVPHGFAGREGAPAGEPGWLARAFDSADARASGASSGPSGATVWVAPPVLAAVNRAYDLAVAHRALEVRLEHLVHALTLIDETAVTLERHGIRVATLRRESAAVIAEQRPDGPLNGRAEPFTSQELIDTLRLAAESAYQRRSPTTTEDILAVLFDMKRETSSRTLLARHRSDWNLNAPAEPRERVRVSAGSHIIGGEGGPRGEQHTVTDAFQNNRLDAIERVVRELAQDVGGERRMIADLLAEIQRGNVHRAEPVQTTRTGTLDRLSALEQAILENRAPKAAPAEAAVATDFTERVQRIERSVENKFAELARTWTLLGERLQSIEELMLEERPAAALELPQTLTRRLESLDGLEGKLKSLEQSVTLVLDQFGTLERRLDEAGRVDVDLTPVSARLGEIEHHLKSSGQAVSIDLAPLENRLRDIERLVATGATGVVDLDPINGHLKEIEGRASDAALYLEGVSERLDTIESHIDAQRAGLAQTSATIGSELKAVAATISSQRATAERLEAVLGDRIQSLLGGIERQRGELAQTIASQGEQRAHDLVHVSGQINALAEHIGRLPQPVEDPRIGQLMHLVASQAGQIHELQQALVTVNSNQQTIAGSLDQWRTENAGDLGIIANRLQLIETTSRRPAEMLHRMSAEIGTISKSLAHREERKSRFKMWLFGTEDWVGAGWRKSEPKTDRTV